MNKKNVDGRIIELKGTNFLENFLADVNLFLAFTKVDYGTDAFVMNKGCSIIRPLQLKVSADNYFVINKKYKKIHNLLMVYIWNIGNGKDYEIYALTYNEAVNILNAIGNAHQSASWKEKGAYHIKPVTIRVRKELQKYRMSPQKFLEKTMGM